MSFVVAKVVRSGVVFVVEMWLWLALWRRWLVQNNDSKRIILPQRSQPGYTNNSL